MSGHLNPIYTSYGESLGGTEYLLQTVGIANSIQQLQPLQVIINAAFFLSKWTSLLSDHEA